MRIDVFDRPIKFEQVTNVIKCCKECSHHIWSYTEYNSGNQSSLCTHPVRTEDTYVDELLIAKDCPLPNKNKTTEEGR
jgi:hypothetical protein